MCVNKEYIHSEVSAKMEKAILESLVNYISVASKSAVLVLSEMRLVVSSGVSRFGFVEECFSLGELMKCATPRTIKKFGQEGAVWDGFRQQFSNVDCSRCCLFINLDFVINGQDKVIHFTFKQLTPSLYLVFLEDGHAWLEIGKPYVLDSDNKAIYYFDNGRWFFSDDNLSDKEKQILKFSARGLTVRDIADKVCLTSDAVNYHKRNIFNKLNVKTMNEAMHKFMAMTSAPVETLGVGVNSFCQVADSEARRGRGA